MIITRGRRSRSNRRGWHTGLILQIGRYRCPSRTRIGHVGPVLVLLPDSRQGHWQQLVCADSHAGATAILPCPALPAMHGCLRVPIAQTTVSGTPGEMTRRCIKASLQLCTSHTLATQQTAPCDCLCAPATGRWRPSSHTALMTAPIAAAWRCAADWRVAAAERAAAAAAARCTCQTPSAEQLRQRAPEAATAHRSALCRTCSTAVSGLHLVAAV